MGQFYLKSLLLLVTIITAKAFPANSKLSLVTTTETLPTLENFNKASPERQTVTPKIYEMHIKSDVSNRYANTTITSKVKNLSNTSQEAVFTVVLPEKAFISGFIMEIDGKNYSAYVKEKEEAKQIYNEAKESGIGAAHVDVSARDSNRFTVSANIEPESKAAFYLTYEELLQRKDGVYELVINIHPGQPVKDLDVEVNINETRKITDLKTPPLRSGNEIGNDDSELDPRADVRIINDTSAVVKFNPNIEKQKKLANVLGTKKDDGLAGQFVVQYDVERDPSGGEILVKDGYFIHFFAPTDVPPLDKHVVFILDTSTSMEGDKINQLKEAMSNILNELKPDDLFNVIEFNTDVKVWNLDDSYDHWTFDDVPQKYMSLKLPEAYRADSENIQRAKDNVEDLEPMGGTNIFDALIVGLNMVNSTKNKVHANRNVQPLIIFLTDGEATVGVTEPENIINDITEFTEDSAKCPIFSLSFGNGADKKFLQKLSSQNLGFSRHIYEAADASLQLQDYYRQISSPVLSDVQFNYQPSVTSLTQTNFPIHFDGSELVVAGWCGTDALYPEIDGFGIGGPIQFTPVIERAISSTERLWAYMTIQQLLDEKETSVEAQEELEKKILDLALKYSFVTPITSLVVVKPNATTSVDTEKADKKERVFVPYAQGLIGPGLPISPLAGDFFSYNGPGYFVQTRLGAFGLRWGESAFPTYENPFDTILTTTEDDIETLTNPITTSTLENKSQTKLQATTTLPNVTTESQFESSTSANQPENEKNAPGNGSASTESVTTTLENITTRRTTTTTLKSDGINNNTMPTNNTTKTESTTTTPDNDTARTVKIYTLKGDESSISTTIPTIKSDTSENTSSIDTPTTTPAPQPTNLPEFPEESNITTPQSTPSISTTIRTIGSNTSESSSRSDTPITTQAPRPTNLPELPDDVELLTTEANPIVNELPWLEQVLNTNQTITLQYGEYPLGLNETMNDIVNCPQTPLNGTGHCKLLNACSHVNSLVTSLEVFIKHFCLLNKKYAGICCPVQ